MFIISPYADGQLTDSRSIFRKSRSFNRLEDAISYIVNRFKNFKKVDFELRKFLGQSPSETFREWLIGEARIDLWYFSSNQDIAPRLYDRNEIFALTQELNISFE